MAKKSINIRAGFDMKAFSTSSQNLTRSLKSTGKKMQSVGKSMSMSLTAPIVALGGLAVKTFADFEQSMAKVKAISGATGKDFEALTQTAKDLGISTRFAASEVSDLMLNYSKLGFSSDEIQKITASTLDLALATGEDLATSAMVAGGTLRAFGLDASQMGMVTDVMAKSFSSSALDLNKFQVSMSSIAPVAKGLGQSLQQTTAQLGVLVNNGIEASTAGTMLRNMMLKATKDGFSMEEALSDIASSTDKASTSLKYFDTRATATALVLAENITQVQGLNDTLLDSEGAAKGMAEIMDNTLEGSMMKLKSATEGLGISFGEILAPAIGKIANFVSDMAMKFANLDKSTKKTILIVAALAAGIGPLIFALGGLSIAMSVIAANPITLSIIAIVGALIALNAALEPSIELTEQTKTSVGRLSMANNILETSIIKINDLKSQSEKLSKTEIANTIKQTKATIKKTKADLQEFEALKKVLAVKLEGKIERAISATRGKSGDRMSVQLNSIKRMQAQVDAYTSSINETKTTLTELETLFSTLDEDLNKAGEVTIPKLTPPKKIVKDIEDSLDGMVVPMPELDFSKLNIGNPNDLVKVEPIEIDVKVNKDGFNEVIEKLGSFATTAQIKAQEIGREMGAALNNGLQNLVTEGLVSLGQFIGDVMAGGDMTVADFGRGLLDSIGKFMGQFGEAMIAMGIAQTLLKASIATMNPAAAIIGGVALVAAGAAISTLSKKGVDSGSSAPSPSYSGSGSAFNNKDNGYSFENNITLSGRDMIITQKRERAFGR